MTKALTMPITGWYDKNNAAPLAFSLNNRTCETFVSATPGAPSRQVEHLSVETHDGDPHRGLLVDRPDVPPVDGGRPGGAEAFELGAVEPDPVPQRPHHACDQLVERGGEATFGVGPVQPERVRDVGGGSRLHPRQEDVIRCAHLAPLV